MDYVRIKPYEPSVRIRAEIAWDDWKERWLKATGEKERIGLLHGIADTSGGDPAEKARYLIEIIVDYRRARCASPNALAAQNIAGTGMAILAKRFIKTDRTNSLFSDEMIPVFLWLFHIEYGRMLNMVWDRSSDSYREVVERFLKDFCCEIIYKPRYAEYVGQALRILHACGWLSLLLPSRRGEITSHPWQALSPVVLAGLEELAIEDVEHLGGHTVEFALVHGSYAALICIGARLAKSELKRLQTHR